MARWKLIEPHYLSVEDCVWEQSETDRETGRARRKTYPVPMHLDPKSPADWNYKPNSGHVSTGGNSFEEGVIIVCWKGKGERKDIVFNGNPTPGMEPIDEEAREVSSRFVWVDPINEFDAGLTMSEKAVMDGQKTMSETLIAMRDLMEQNTKLLAMVAQLIAQPERRA